jgi:histidinol-phosphate aminotransferase
VVDAGADSLILLTLRSRINPGDTVVTSAGTYPTFKYFAEGVGAQIVEVPYKDTPDGLSVDLGALSAAARQHDAALVYIANPDNPTGHVHTAASITELRKSLPESTTLLLDEAYIDFSPGHALRLSPRSESWQNTIQLRTLSKAYGLAGLTDHFLIRLSRHLIVFAR